MSDYIGFFDFNPAIRSGSAQATGSVRLDNEVDLARMLGGAPAAGAGGRGLDLVVRAYERWGKDFAAHLVGDFAVVVFDLARGVVCAARDPFGVRPLAYRRTKGGMAFASDAGALSHFEGESGEIDERSVRDFLTGDERSSTRTFFREVHRLAPGHVLRADRTTTVLERYWFPPAHVRTETRAACLEEFSARFKSAVSNRLRSESPILVHVSGGLDSSSIACVASAVSIDRKPALHLMSAHFAEADERPYLASIERHLRSPIEVFDAVPGDDDDALDRSHPSRYPLAAMTVGIGALAARTGARVVLSGLGGDELLFERGVYRDLAADTRWLTLWREAGLANRYSTRSRMFYLLDALRPRALPKALKRAVRFARRLRGRNRLPWLRLPPTEADDSLSSGDLPDHAWASQTQRFNWEWLTSPRLVASLEAEDRAASRDGLEMRYPFLDRRLAELVLGTAYEHRIPSGRMKVLLRDALAGVLPDQVRERSQVTIFDPVIAAAVSRKSRFVSDAIERGPWCSERYVDRAGARAALRRFVADPADCSAAITVWDIASLEHWLRAVM